MKPGYVGLDDNGSEVLDDTPVSIPVRFRSIPSQLQEILDTRNLIRSELSRIAEERGYGNFEEEDDFDVGEDFEPITPYELSGVQEDDSWSDFRDQFGPKRASPVADEAGERTIDSGEQGGKEVKRAKKGDKQGKQDVGGKHGKSGSAPAEGSD